jgi:hypothetical protein
VQYIDGLLLPSLVDDLLLLYRILLAILLLDVRCIDDLPLLFLVYLFTV